MTTYSKILTMGVAAAALMAGQAWAQGTERVGVVSAVNPAAVGTPPGAETRPIVIGSDVRFRERVVTTGDGQAQLMFLDQSTMMIGPNSQVVIDEFVYDPNTSSGKFAATLTQGSFRYIGGKLSKQGNATLKTPVATIGIRGSDVIVNHNANTNASGIQNIQGNATVQSNGQTVRLPTGFGTTINGPGQAPSYPESLTAAIINAAKVTFEGQPGKTAGAAKPPANADVEKSGLSDTVEAARLAGIETAAGGGAGGGNSPNIPVVPNTRPSDGALLSAPPSPSTPSGTAATMVGYVGGAGDRFIGDDSVFRPYFITNDSPSEVKINTQPGQSAGQSGTVAASISFRSLEQIAIPSANVLIGDANGSTGNSVLVSDNQFVAVSPTDTGETVIINEAGDTAPINATVNGAPATASMVLVTYSQALGNLSQFVQNAQNVNVCTCEFMSWGFMVGTLQHPLLPQRVDLILGTFVTGVLPDISAKPTATASFSGHVMGVSSRSGGYTAGNFALNNYSFAAGSGNLAITNFDGNNMNGTVNARANDWRSYSGSIAPTGGLPTGPATIGTANGSFYVVPGSPAGTVPQGTGGNVVLTGPNGYAASGTFVGKR